MARNPPPQSPYYNNYVGNPVSPKHGADRLPDVPEQPNTNSSTNTSTPPAKEQRLIVVSNRLPVTISKDKNGEYHFSMSSGGLVSALSGTKKKMSFTWIGWPGKHVSDITTWYQPTGRYADLLDPRGRPGTRQQAAAGRVQLLPSLLVGRTGRPALQWYVPSPHSEDTAAHSFQAFPTRSFGRCSTTTPER